MLISYKLCILCLRAVGKLNQMEATSRFQRLFDLVESGTSAQTRSAAAEQIAAIYLDMPEGESCRDFFDVLLGKLVPLLGHSEWDTRVAAAHVIRLLAPHSNMTTLEGRHVALPDVLSLMERSDEFLGVGKIREPSAEAIAAAAEPEKKRVKAVSSRQQNVNDRKARERLKTSQATLGDPWKEGAAMPWHELFHFLTIQLLCPRWETRHGALVALRGLMEQTQCPTLLPQVAAKCLTVLVRDRFNDYLGDRVVSPVRECAAQLLGTVLVQANEALFSACVQVLLQMVQRPEWEVRHAALLGLRYAVSNRPNSMHAYAPLLIQPMLSALEDEDDDVIAVAAETMLPLSANVAENIDATCDILDRIWQLLESLDDLAASIACLLQLVSALYSVPHIAQRRPLGANVLRLVPLFRHGVQSVRLAALHTMVVLLTHGTPAHWALPLSADLFRHCFHNFIIETDTAVIKATRQLWSSLLQHAPAEQLCGPILKPLLMEWYSKLVASCGSSDIEQGLNPAAFLVEGCAVIGKLLATWPAAQVAGEILTLVKLACSQSAGERIVGGMCFSSFALTPGVSFPVKYAVAFRKKFLEVLGCDWATIMFNEDTASINSVWSQYLLVARHMDGVNLSELCASVPQMEEALLTLENSQDLSVKVFRARSDISQWHI